MQNLVVEGLLKYFKVFRILTFFAMLLLLSIVVVMQGPSQTIPYIVAGALLFSSGCAFAWRRFSVMQRARLQLQADAQRYDTVWAATLQAEIADCNELLRLISSMFRGRSIRRMARSSSGHGPHQMVPVHRQTSFVALKAAAVLASSRFSSFTLSKVQPTGAPLQLQSKQHKNSGRQLDSLDQLFAQV